MPETTRPNARPRHDGLTALALAAGLAFGHIVAAMAELGPLESTTLPAALVFAAAASASTLCVLANLASAQSTPARRARLARWIVALGLGFAGSLGPRLF